MNIIKKYYLPILLLFLFSCTKTLRVDPTSLITTASFWKTEDDAKGMINGMYVKLRDASSLLFSIGEQRSEIYQFGPIGPSSDFLFQNNLTADAPGTPDWGAFYSTLNSANLIIKYVPDIPFKTEAAKNNILAQAYTMRAFAHFAMVKTWGDVVVRTEPIETSNPDVTQKERTPVAQVFTQIKDDIETALSLYPDYSFPAGRAMWSKASASALKADVYLWTGKVLGGGQADFTAALEACNAAQQADAVLLDNFSDIFKYENKGNEEILMSIRFQDLDGQNIDNYFAIMWIHESSIPINVSQLTRDLALPTGNGQDRNVITDIVRNQFVDEDSRKSGSFHEIYTFDDNGDSTFYTALCLKGSGFVNFGTRRFISDIIIYRYADVLLMKAEAKNALSQDPKPEMDMIRQRAFGSSFAGHEFATGSIEDNDAAILKERLLELLYEGKRWWDLRRFGKVFEIVPNLQNRPDPNLLLFPIATTVLALEPKISQNPGY